MGFKMHKRGSSSSSASIAVNYSSRRASIFMNSSSSSTKASSIHNTSASIPCEAYDDDCISTHMSSGGDGESKFIKLIHILNISNIEQYDLYFYIYHIYVFFMFVWFIHNITFMQEVPAFNSICWPSKVMVRLWMNFYHHEQFI